MTISAIIVDDEAHAREALANALQAHPRLQVIAQCENGVEAVRQVQELRPQVLFLDIHMPRLDGFDVLELLGDTAPIIVFVTAHDEYAVRAFDARALDYLLKPVDPERLMLTVERIGERLGGDELDRYADVTASRQRQQAPLRRLLVRDGTEVHIVAADEIIYIESADDYVVIHTIHRTFIKQDRLQHLEELLNQEDFCRIHRSYLLNLDSLAGIENESKDQRIALLRDGRRLPISRSGYQRLRSLL